MEALTIADTTLLNQARYTLSNDISIPMSLMSSLQRMDLRGRLHHFTLYTDFNGTTSHRCDERFVGYGGNKAACLFEMYISGMNFYVLADDFLIHRSHPYEEKVRSQEVSASS